MWEMAGMLQITALTYNYIKSFWSSAVLLYIYIYTTKQWQPTPKNLLRMQCTRAIPVAWLGSGSC